MSLSETELIYLMAYVDDQVDDDELPEVTALLARSEEARQIVAQHAAMGDWVRETSEAKAVAAGADKIAATVHAEIEKLGGGKVIGIERERARVALNRQRVKEFGALFAVAAVSLAFWLMPASRPDTVALAPTATTVKAPVKKTATSPQPSSAVAGNGMTNGAPNAGGTPTNDPNALAANGGVPGPDGLGGTGNPGDPEAAGVDVQNVESPSHPFSIFYVPADTGLNAHSSAVVVWIGE